MIIGFGAAAGEDDFLGLGADERGDLFARGFDGGARLLPGRVDGGSVGETGGEIGEHAVEHGGVDGSGGVVIEIDAHGSVLVRMLLQGGEEVRMRREWRETGGGAGGLARAESRRA